MSTTTHVEGLDRTLHKTNEWLDDLQEELGWSERRRTYHALRTTLHALRDRLTPDEAANFAAQLPLLIAGVYYDGWKPAGRPYKTRKKEEFLEGIRQGFSLTPEVDPEEVARGVMNVIRRHVTEGELDNVLGQLPEEIRSMFTAGARGA